MFWELHANRATTAQKKEPHKLEMYPVWPNCGFLLADYYFVRIGQAKASVSVGENVPKRMEEAEMELGSFVGINIRSTAR